MAEVVFNTGKARLAAGRLAVGVTTLKAVAIIGTKTGASDPDLATLAAIDAVTNVNFASNRATLASVTNTLDLTNDRLGIDCADFSFAATSGATALAIVIYDATTDTDDSTRIPVAFYDTGFGAGLPMDGGLNVAVPNDFFRVA